MVGTDHMPSLPPRQGALAVALPGFALRSQGVTDAKGPTFRACGPDVTYRYVLHRGEPGNHTPTLTVYFWNRCWARAKWVDMRTGWGGHRRRSEAAIRLAKPKRILTLLYRLPNCSGRSSSGPQTEARIRFRLRH